MIELVLQIVRKPTESGRVLEFEPFGREKTKSIMTNEPNDVDWKPGRFMVPRPARAAMPYDNRCHPLKKEVSPVLSRNIAWT